MKKSDSNQLPLATAPILGQAPRDITAVIVAGGQGARMGGLDKGLVELRNRPLIRHVIDTIRPQVTQLVINANRNHEAYRQFGFPVVADTVDGFQGPLAGFLSALERITTTDMVIVPCDTPLLTDQLVNRLSRAREIEGAEIAVAHDGQRLQPICALIPKSLRQSLNEYLETGGRKIDRWYAMHKMAVVDFSDVAESFININTLDELQHYQ